MKENQPQETYGIEIAMTEESFVFREPALSAQTYTAEGRDQLLLHIKTGDYFAALSTLLGFLEESSALCQEDTLLAHAQARAIKAARNDLAFLDKKYRIIPKDGQEHWEGFTRAK